MTTTLETTGRKPTGSCPPDGSHRWATRSFNDGTYTFVEYDGWLIANETTTTDPELATLVWSYLKAWKR